jgi:hypothetical protein
VFIAGVPVRCKVEPALSQGLQATLSCLPADFTLQPYQEGRPLQLLLRPALASKAEEVLQDEKLVVYVGSARCREEVLVSARIVQPCATLQLEGHEGCVQQGEVLDLDPLQPGQKRVLVFTLSNTGGYCALPSKVYVHCATVLTVQHWL